MFSPSQMSSTASTLFSAYASFAGSVMLVRSMANDLIPQSLQSYLQSTFLYFFRPVSSNLTLIIDEHCGMSRNEVFDAAEIYLRTKISSKTERLKVGKTPRQKHFAIAIDKGEEVADSFEDFQLCWKFVCTEPQERNSSEKRFFELTFDKKFKDKVLDSYLAHVLDRAEAIKEEDKVVKLYNRDCPYGDDYDGGGGMWGSIHLEHPSTFDTLAMDPEVKKFIVNDLDRFKGRREFYKKVGKAWKRGYLLYGPPGTGKSSLIAAMANYLKFDVYDLELTSIYDNSDLRRILLSTSNRSILVIEDIDCSVQTHNRQNANDITSAPSKLTLSGILNFIDGLWSSCGDERIIVFTTNHKDRLDPALLRPGRMDVHINMSYCTVPGFKQLASNYLGDSGKCHRLCGEIEGLIESMDVTPAEVAEELMKSDDADVALAELVKFLKRKSESNKIQQDQAGTDKVEHQEPKRSKADGSENKIVKNNRRRKNRRR